METCEDIVCVVGQGITPPRSTFAQLRPSEAVVAVYNVGDEAQSPVVQLFARGSLGICPLPLRLLQVVHMTGISVRNTVTISSLHYTYIYICMYNMYKYRVCARCPGA